jgi:DNA/RNA-binding domain of Phe-tRNA-synthetase-like protein
MALVVNSHHCRLSKKDLSITMLRVSDEIFRAFPDVILGVVIFQNINNVGQRAELNRRLVFGRNQTVALFANSTINEHPHIAPWREAYRRFGAKPKDYPSSIENLVHLSKISSGAW